jgi:hypothetical protein
MAQEQMQHRIPQAHKTQQEQMFLQTLLALKTQQEQMFLQTLLALKTQLKATLQVILQFHQMLQR